MFKAGRTDLACEADTQLFHIDGTKYETEDLGICRLEKLSVLTSDAAKKIERECGNYITVSTSKIQFLGESELDALALVIGNEIRSLLKRCSGRPIDADLSVLVAGLGNSKITADAIGPETIERLDATRHLKNRDQKLFELLGMCSVSAMIPGVLGKTGIESADLIKAAVKEISPHTVIVIDALAARSMERLAKTIQITDSGIKPGAGIGNRRDQLDRESLGVPVIAIGIPTVIDTASVICEFLPKQTVSGSSSVSEDLIKQAENNFVTPKDADTIIENSAILLARSLEEAFVIS